MDNITLSCRYGYIKIVDMDGKHALHQFPQIGHEIDRPVLSQLCLGLKGNQQFESGVMICGSGQITRLNGWSAIAIYDRIWVVCGDCLFCLDMPNLNEQWRYQKEGLACLGVSALDDDVLVMFSGELARLSRTGMPIWTTSIPEQLQQFPIIGATALDCYANGKRLLRVNPINGGVMESCHGP